MPIGEGSSFWAGMGAVVAVNLVVAVYVIMALMDPPTSSEPHPDPKFVEQARQRLEEMSQATIRTVKAGHSEVERPKNE